MAGLRVMYLGGVYLSRRCRDKSDVSRRCISMAGIRVMYLGGVYQWQG